MYLYRLRKITAGISISKSVEKYYRNLGIKIPFHTIYNGIDLAEFTLNENKKYWKKKIGIDEHAITFVVVGHLSKLKDPLLVIKSYISLINKGLLKNTVLIFCGSGLEEKKCKELAKPYSQILFKGYVFNVSDYLKAADFSICASHSEGFGLNYIEAMAAGAFVLSSKIPAFNEFAEICPILKEYQFGVGNQKELEKCMLSVGGGIVDKLCISSGIIEKFSSENMGKEHMDLYEKYYKNGNDFK